jgi:hypothetical protein
LPAFTLPFAPASFTRDLLAIGAPYPPLFGFFPDFFAFLINFDDADAILD